MGFYLRFIADSYDGGGGFEPSAGSLRANKTLL